MKIKSCYTLKEFLRPIHIEKFLSYIEKIYGNVLDDIEVKKSDKEKTLEFPNKIQPINKFVYLYNELRLLNVENE